MSSSKTVLLSNISRCTFSFGLECSLPKVQIEALPLRRVPHVSHYAPGSVFWLSTPAPPQHHPWLCCSFSPPLLAVPGSCQHRVPVPWDATLPPVVWLPCLKQKSLHEALSVISCYHWHKHPACHLTLYGQPCLLYSLAVLANALPRVPTHPSK